MKKYNKKKILKIGFGLNSEPQTITCEDGSIFIHTDRCTQNSIFECIETKNGKEFKDVLTKKSYKHIEITMDAETIIPNPEIFNEKQLKDLAKFASELTFE